MSYDGVHCPCCSDPYNDPRVLQCLHTICHQCLKTKSTPPPNLKCPLCSFATHTPTIERLPRNYLAVEAARRAQGFKSCFNCSQNNASRYCTQCASCLCEECSDAIHRHAIFAGHDVVDFESSSSSCATPPRQTGGASNNSNSQQRQQSLLVTCTKHASDVLSLFCVTCKICICKQCATDTHRGHTVQATDVAARTFVATQLPAMIKTISRVGIRADNGVGNVHDALRRLDKHAERCSEQIDAHFDILANVVNARRHEVHNILAAKVDSKRSLLLEQRATLQQLVHNVNHSITLGHAMSRLSSQSTQDTTTTAVSPLSSPQNGGDDGDGGGGILDVERALALHALSTQATMSAESPFKAATASPGQRQQQQLGGAMLDPSTVSAFAKMLVSPACFADICGGIGNYTDYVAQQRIDDRPCVEPVVKVDFEHTLNHAMRIVQSVGEVVARSVCERSMRFAHIGDNQGLMFYYGTSKLIKLYANPVLSNSVHVSCSSIGYGKPENVVAAQQADFCTQNFPNSYVVIQIENKFVPTHYVIHHDAYDKDAHFLRHWELQGWNDAEEEWETLCLHVNDTTLHAKNQVGAWEIPPMRVPGSAFEVEEQLTEEEQQQQQQQELDDDAAPTNNMKHPGFSRFKVIQTDKNSHGNHYMMLSAVEFYGTLVGEK